MFNLITKKTNSITLNMNASVAKTLLEKRRLLYINSGCANVNLRSIRRGPPLVMQSGMAESSGVFVRAVILRLRRIITTIQNRLMLNGFVSNAIERKGMVNL